MVVAAAVGHFPFPSDCQTAELVDAAGSVVWWPGEAFDGPSVFRRLLDHDAGHFDLRAVDRLETRRRAPVAAATGGADAADL